MSVHTLLDAGSLRLNPRLVALLSLSVWRYSSGCKPLNPSIRLPLDIRTYLSDTLGVKGSEFIRRVKKLGKAREVDVSWVAERSKGSHGTLYFGNAHTIVRNKTDELKTGTLHGMLAQLGLTIDDLNEPKKSDEPKKGEE